MVGQDALDKVVRDGVSGLRKYIELLESLLDSARAAETLFRVGHYPVEGTDPRDREVPSSSHTPHSGPSAGSSRTNPEHDEVYRRLEAALRAERLTGHNRVLRGLRVIAAANGGMLDFGLTCRVLTDVGVCRGTPANVASYISRRLRTLDEFERVGEPGTGMYRWLSYQEESLDNSLYPVSDDCGSPGPEGAVGDS